MTSVSLYVPKLSSAALLPLLLLIIITIIIVTIIILIIFFYLHLLTTDLLSCFYALPEQLPLGRAHSAVGCVEIKQTPLSLKSHYTD